MKNCTNSWNHKIWNNWKIGFFYFKFRGKNWQKLGNLHRTLKTTKFVKIGNFSLLLQIQETLTQNWENLPNSQNHKLLKDWKFLIFYCKFGKFWQMIGKIHQTLETQSFSFSIRDIRKFTLSSPCLWASFHGLTLF